MNVSIEKIAINSFGKLKNAYVSLDSGINVLSAPNESGKSTLAAFIKFVFYGYSGARMQTVADNEKKLYTPWDNEISEGSITISADEEKYMIHRKSGGTGKDVCEIINRSTGKQEFAGMVPGEVFFGVGEEIFARTLFFRQLTVPHAKDEVLADRLQDIAISADEQVSTKKAISKLSEAKNEIKGRMGTGLLPKAEKDRDALEMQITESENLRRETIRLLTDIKKRERLIEESRSKLERFNAERRNIEKYEASLKLKNINRLTLEEDLAKEEYEKVSSGLKQHSDGGALRSLYAKNTELVAEQRKCDTVAESLKQAEDEYNSVKNEIPFGVAEAKAAESFVKKSETVGKIAFVAAAVAVVLALIIFLASKNAAAFLGVALAVVLVALGAVMLNRATSKAKALGMKNVAELRKAIERLPELQKRIKEAEGRYNALNGAYEELRLNCRNLKKELDEGIGQYADVNGDGDYEEALQQILEISTVSGEKLALWRAKQEELKNALDGVDKEQLTEEARGAVTPEREKAIVDRDINFCTQQTAQLSDLNRRDELQYAGYDAKIGDTALMVGKRNALEETVRDLSLKHKAYEAAIRLINESGDYMKSMVAPRISQRADEYFTAATGGKYSALEIDTRLTMSYGEDFRRSCDYLSAGTRDSAYLSLRLALADMLFGGNAVPILLDDAFVRIDDNRLRMMSGALNEAAKTHQLLILTHSDRETEAFKDSGIDYTEVSIKTV